MKPMKIMLACGLLALTAACETIPFEERAKAYEDQMAQRFVGKSADELVLAFGPPQSSYKLTDGRDVLQYEQKRTNTQGGESYTSFREVTRFRTETDAAGNVRTVQYSESIPVTNSSPVYTVNQNCIRRFVVASDKKVESFRWEGNACFR
ncbi:hypothetical protein [Aquidulcibacter sp.]|jgi:hypothetical protein|uniref:hypothetical protein n=1 Tax=Aquidulcibacter sp. TaxID=2052990 RepID=UPI0037C13C28